MQNSKYFLYFQFSYNYILLLCPSLHLPNSQCSLCSLSSPLLHFGTPKPLGHAFIGKSPELHFQMLIWSTALSYFLIYSPSSGHHSVSSSQLPLVLSHRLSSGLLMSVLKWDVQSRAKMSSSSLFGYYTSAHEATDKVSDFSFPPMPHPLSFPAFTT